MADTKSLAVTAAPPVLSPVPADAGNGFNVMVTGIGGTGVITVGAVLAMAARLEGKGASTYNMTGLAQKNGPVFSHLRFTSAPERVPAFRVEAGDADLVLACDVLAALMPEAASTIREGRTQAVINTGVEPTAAFQLFRDSSVPGQTECARLTQQVGTQATHAVNATETAVRLLGDKIAANMVMVGFALQKGLLPLGVDSVVRAIELNDVAVEINKRALEIGRQLAAGAIPELEINDRAAPPPTSDEVLENEIDMARAHLRAYQDEACAARFERRVRSVAEAERARTPGSNGLAIAVARNYRKVMAYKDEYEVARLYSTPEFRAAIDEAFEGHVRLSVLLAPPLLGGRPGPGGNPSKREFGPWIFGLLRLLARMRRLRGTPLDIFGWTHERRRERQFITSYEQWLDTIETTLRPENHQIAMRLAALPADVRGFGQIKLRSMDTAEASARELLATLSQS